LVAQGLLFLVLAQVLRARRADVPIGPAPRARADAHVAAETSLAETGSTAVKT
jgi:hypothetical protein